MNLQRIGQVLTVFGVVLVLAPLFAGAASILIGVHVPAVLDRVPSFVLSGITCFVLGIGLREFSN